ncbi:MAG TPA: SAM-dependent methyltransferase [Chitinophagaceae bacterium]|nr:SAM-dependent methyltransferase [Chitinophagaceae bacterium]
MQLSPPKFFQLSHPASHKLIYLAASVFDKQTGLMKIADNTDQHSLSTQFRRKRFEFFLGLIRQLPRPLHILDIGGTEAYWEMMQFDEPDVHITLLNLRSEPVSDTQRFTSISGDATQLDGFADQSVDLIYSNSVIEHLFTLKAQQKMADEIRRVGKSYFIQTPYRYFPIEPHWVFPFFQFLPRFAKIGLTRQFSLGHIPRAPDAEKAARQVDEVRLMTISELKKIFPGGLLYKEFFMGMVKSVVMYKI